MIGVISAHRSPPAQITLSDNGFVATEKRLGR